MKGALIASAVVLTMMPGLAFAQARAAQHRGIWMHATSAKTATEADVLLDRIQHANLNAIYCLVFYWGGHAYYESEIVPRAEDIAQDFDPLKYLVDGAHKRGIELHAWFVNGENGSPEPGTVFAKHPDWMIVGRDGRPRDWYDFGKPEVREFQRDVMLEVLRKYDVDGIHFDYIRYPGPDYCYCDQCKRRFEEQHGPLLPDMLGEAFPLAARFSANPLAGPTTAQVLAQFDHGVPAILLNKVDKGECLLLNWHAEEHGAAAVSTVLKRALAQFGAGKDNVYVHNTPSNREKYGDRFLESGIAWLKSLGFTPQRLPAGKSLGDLKPGDVLFLTCVYMMAKDEAEALEAFVRTGGHVVFVDGPVFAIREPAVQRVTGMARIGGYFSEEHIILPVGESDLIPKREGQIDLARYHEAILKWRAFQKAGITELVRDVYRQAKQLKPDRKVTAAVFYTRAAADNVSQDWYAWLKEGIVDYVIPMAYTMNDEELKRALDEWRAADPKLEHIIPGLSIYQRDGAAASPRPPDIVLRQTRLCLDAGARGTCYFAVNYLSDALVEAVRGVK